VLKFFLGRAAPLPTPLKSCCRCLPYGGDTQSRNLCKFLAQVSWLCVTTIRISALYILWSRRDCNGDVYGSQSSSVQVGRLCSASLLPVLLSILSQASLCWMRVAWGRLLVTMGPGLAWRRTRRCLTTASQVSHFTLGKTRAMRNRNQEAQLLLRKQGVSFMHFARACITETCRVQKTGFF